MTFTEIVTHICTDLGLTSTAATTRIGNKVNLYYRAVTSSVGITIGRPAIAVSTNTVNGTQTVTFSMERVDRVYYDAGGSVVEFDIVPLEEIRKTTPVSGFPSACAIEFMGAGSVRVRFNKVPTAAYAVKADGLVTASTLSGSQVPQFPLDFHDILILRVEADERRKDERATADALDAMARRRESQLRLFVATSLVREQLQP